VANCFAPKDGVLSMHCSATWIDKSSCDATARKLGEMFRTNFSAYEGSASLEVSTACC
jgi:ATP-dependent phosphoenolpyruvate carboxykinase